MRPAISPCTACEGHTPATKPAAAAPAASRERRGRGGGPPAALPPPPRRCCSRSCGRCSHAAAARVVGRAPAPPVVVALASRITRGVLGAPERAGVAPLSPGASCAKRWWALSGLCAVVPPTRKHRAITTPAHPSDSPPPLASHFARSLARRWCARVPRPGGRRAGGDHGPHAKPLVAAWRGSYEAFAGQAQGGGRAHRDGAGSRARWQRRCRSPGGPAAARAAPLRGQCFRGEGAGGGTLGAGSPHR